MPLHLLTAPQLAPLLDHLAEAMARDPLAPREHEVVVVQSQGMRRWITLQLADRHGCAAGVELPFPTTLVRDLARTVLGETVAPDAHDPFSRDVLTWRLDALLESVRRSADPDFAPLSTYLDRADARTRFGLAAQVAARFDDYQMFRADLLEAWEAGEDRDDTPTTPSPAAMHARWQRRLWRTLRAEREGGVPHTGSRIARLIAALTEPAAHAAGSDAGRTARRDGLPSRLTVFGVSTLPPLFLDLLQAIAGHIPVTLYVATADAATPHAATLHPLAVAYGAQAQEFAALLVERGAQVQRLGGTPSGRSLLATLQREIATGADGGAPLVVAPDDASLRVHDAHGDMRQLEVVRDQLLAALADDPSLRPHDLLLLVPDAAAWAPKVDAVFGLAVSGAPQLPYRIADRPLRRAQPAAEALARLLALEGGRLERSAVLGLLSLPMVRRGAGLAAGDVEWIEAMLERANIRWGYDADARARLGFPPYEDASWRAGLDRLLLGTAVGRLDDDVLGLLPEAGDLLGEPELLADFAHWVDDLAATLALWRHEQTLTGWTATLLAAVDRFLVADDPIEQQMVTEVAASVRRLSSLGSAAGYDGTLPFAVVRDWLEGELDDDGYGTGFLQGGMTVAALKPMRSLPFRVIAVVGLDDGVFPRRDRRSAFDLLEQVRRPGDRDLRGDDRQLFLDTLMAAGDRLILAYGGRAVSDNSVRSPSVVIDELLDHVGRRASGPEGEGPSGHDAARALLVTTHPLQPFSPAYFGRSDDTRLFSYSLEQAAAARALSHRRETEPPFVTEGIAPADGEEVETFALTLKDLTDCWTNPSKYFCTRTLRLFLGDELAEGADEETFAPNALQQGWIRSRMLAAELAGARDAVAEQRRLIANGALPPNELGKAWHETLWADVATVTAALPADEATPAMRVKLEGDGWQLTGRLDGVRGEVRYAVRAGRISAEHVIRAWVEHLVMLAAREQGEERLPEETMLVWRDRDKARSTSFGRVTAASEKVARLVAATREARRAPLPFFARAGYAWILATAAPAPAPKAKAGKAAAASSKATKPPKAPKDPRADALKKYDEQPSDYSSGGDAEDDYVALCFRGQDPMTERWADFEALAQRLFAGWDEAHGGRGREGIG